MNYKICTFGKGRGGSRMGPGLSKTGEGGTFRGYMDRVASNAWPRSMKLWNVQRERNNIRIRWQTTWASSVGGQAGREFFFVRWKKSQVSVRLTEREQGRDQRRGYPATEDEESKRNSNAEQESKGNKVHEETCKGSWEQRVCVLYVFSKKTKKEEKALIFRAP